jgi:hypothetical protein
MVRTVDRELFSKGVIWSKSTITKCNGMARNYQGFGVLIANGQRLGQVRYDLDEIGTTQRLRGMLSGNGRVLKHAFKVGSVELEQDVGVTLLITMVGVYSEGVAEVLAVKR